MPTCRRYCFVRRAPPTATLSRRRMNWSVLPSPTDKHGSFGSDGGFRDAFNPEPSLKKRNYLLVHAKLPTLGKRFSLAETFFLPNMRAKWRKKRMRRLKRKRRKMRAR